MKPHLTDTTVGSWAVAHRDGGEAVRRGGGAGVGRGVVEGQADAILTSGCLGVGYGFMYSCKTKVDVLVVRVTGRNTC